MIEAGKKQDGIFDAIRAELGKSSKRDRRLFFAAARVNLVYCDALFGAGILSRSEVERVKSGLQTILKRADFNQNYLDDERAEDVHSFIESRLVGLIGEAGAKLSVGRNREEQTLTALRLWLREEIEAISTAAKSLQTALLDAGERQRDAVLPSYANRRRAQPILWAHWCLAYFEMLARDRERLDEAWRRVNVLPLGAANMTGTAIEIDREEVARALRFEGVAANSLDAATDTDFAAEFVGACAILAVHLSRLAEDFILYRSAEFGFLEAIGASEEDNFDLPQQMRQSAGAIIGHQTALAAQMKSLPLGIHAGNTSDAMRAVFETADAVNLDLKIARGVLENARVNEAKTREAATSGFFNADELVDYLVQRETPIKAARETARKIVAAAVAENKNLGEMSLEQLRQFSGVFESDVFDALGLEQTLTSKNQIGGTAPERVFEALDTARLSLEREENS